MTASVVIEVPKDYGYVLLTLAGSFVLSFWHVFHTASYRRAAQVPYPIPYALSNATSKNKYTDTTTALAKEEYLFNCAQRTHGQFLEHYCMFVPMLLVTGLEWPRVASAMGLLWITLRFVYGWGYTRVDKTKGSGRLAGGFYMPIEWAYIPMVAYQGWKILAA